MYELNLIVCVVAQQKQREKKELEQLEKDKQNPMGVAEVIII